MTESAAHAQDLDHTWVAEFAQRWGAAWNSHEPARLLEFMACAFDGVRIRRAGSRRCGAPPPR